MHKPLQQVPMPQVGTSLRRVVPIEVSRLSANLGAAPVPTFKWVEPLSLLVDEKYQRNLSSRSNELIRKIVAEWDWSRFKPPIVAQVELGYEVVDGQHTAIAAASHPGIDTIPVMVINAPQTHNRAAAFIGHNRDRIPITPLQMHKASCAAGDADALMLQAACDEAGLTLLAAQPSDGKYLPGETIAVGAIQRLFARQGDARARKVLRMAAATRLGPIPAGVIRAIELLLYDEQFADAASPEDIAFVFSTQMESLKGDAKLFAATHGIPIWRALGICAFQRARRRKGSRPDC